MNEIKFPILGLDVSKRRIGVAIAESASLTPQSLFTWHRGKRSVDNERIQNWVRKYDITAVVVGLPVNMDGTTGASAEAIIKFIDELSPILPVPIFTQDERQTTLEAREILAENELTTEEAKDKLDEVAAVLILTRYMNEKK